jgi:hypothetical protein
LLLELDGHPFKVELETVQGGAFFRCGLVHLTKVVYINRAHRFYQDVYAGPKSSPDVRAALEVLLLAIGDSILDAPEETSRIYKIELPQWSLKLDLALEHLASQVAFSDDGDAEEPAWPPSDDEASQAA